MADQEIKGCVGVYQNKEGRIVASASDFKPDTYGGFNLFESQKVRTENSLARAVIVAYCSPAVYESLDAYDSLQIVRKLGGKMTFIEITHAV